MPERVRCECGTMVLDQQLRWARHRASPTHRHHELIRQLLATGQHTNVEISRTIGIRRNALYAWMLKHGLSNKHTPERYRSLQRLTVRVPRKDLTQLRHLARPNGFRSLTAYLRRLIQREIERNRS